MSESNQKTTQARRIAEDRDQRFVRGEVRVQHRDADGEDAQPRAVILGTGIVFNKETVIGGRSWGFREVIAPGAFATSITTEDQRSFFNHNPDLILGRRSAGTLVITEDGNGVNYEVDPPDTSYAKDLQESLRRKDVTGSSFVFRTIKEEWTEPPADSDELPLRRILEAELYELGPVSMPQYEDSTASVGARSKAEALIEQRTQARTAEHEREQAAAVAASEARALSLDLRARIAEL